MTELMIKVCTEEVNRARTNLLDFTMGFCNNLVRYYTMALDISEDSPHLVPFVTAKVFERPNFKELLFGTDADVFKGKNNLDPNHGLNILTLYITQLINKVSDTLKKTVLAALAAHATATKQNDTKVKISQLFDLEEKNAAAEAMIIDVDNMDTGDIPINKPMLDKIETTLVNKLDKHFNKLVKDLGGADLGASLKKKSKKSKSKKQKKGNQNTPVEKQPDTSSASKKKKSKKSKKRDSASK
jgi:hypothetical protein